MILHPYSPTGRHDDQRRCWDALKPIRDNTRVIDVPCTEEFDYERSVIAAWGREDLTICEHDIVPTQDMLTAFTECPESVCAQAYLIYPASTMQPDPFYCHAVHWPGGRRWISDGEEWADESGIGLVRFRLEAQLAIDVRELASYGPYRGWKSLDQRIFWAMRRREMRFHVHWPACHHQHQ